MKREILRISGGVKYEAGRELLTDISIQADSGRMYGLLFDDVSEEQCLLQILKGNKRFDDGDIWFREEKMPLHQSEWWMKKNIFHLEFESRASGELTVEDSFFILGGKGIRGFFKNNGGLRAGIGTILEAFEVEVEGGRKLTDLSQLERIQLELIKAFHQGFQIIITRNLAYSLNVTDFGRAMELIVRLKEKGVIIFMVDHDERILTQYVDELIIFRKGRTAYPLTRDKFNRKDIARILMGTVPQKEGMGEIAGAAEVLELKQVIVGQLSPLSFKLRRGEILVLLDKDWYYGEEIAKLLCGERQPDAGSVLLKGKDYRPSSNKEAVRNGVCVIEESPIREDGQLFYNMTALDNIVIGLSNKKGQVTVSRNQEQSIIKESAEFFTKKQLLSKVSELNPSQKQKLVYFKWYLYYPRVVVCIKPFSGVDYQMQQVTEEFIRNFRERGISVVIITQNLSEAHSFGQNVIILEE